MSEVMDEIDEEWNEDVWIGTLDEEDKLALLRETQAEAAAMQAQIDEYEALKRRVSAWKAKEADAARVAEFSSKLAPAIEAMGLDPRIAKLYADMHPGETKLPNQHALLGWARKMRLIAW